MHLEDQDNTPVCYDATAQQYEYDTVVTGNDTTVIVTHQSIGGGTEHGPLTLDAPALGTFTTVADGTECTWADGFPMTPI